MSTLDFLSQDFRDIAAEDIGVNVTIKHKAEQKLNTVTGEYTTTEVTETKTCIVDRISVSDVKLYPHKLSVEDKKVYISEDDFSFVICKGDVVVIGTSEYVVVETNELDSVLLLYCKKKT